MNAAEIVMSAGDLPAFPGIALKALELLENPDTSARQLQYVILKDQALTARILKIVNSAMYAVQGQVSTLSHAIALLGMETVRSVIVAASVRKVFHSEGRGLTSQLLWQHSWGTAVAAKAISVCTKYPNAEEAFIGGLLHDLGKMLLLKNRTEFFGEIVDAVRHGETTFNQAELDRFGFSHAHIGSLLAAKWHFPAQLIEAIRYHHDPAAAPEYGHLTAIVSLANQMMVLLEIGFEKNKLLNLEETAAARCLNVAPAALQKLVAEVQLMLSKTPGIERL
jgi:putative nucleotidyltransferase with HDIG domain